MSLEENMDDLSVEDPDLVWELNEGIPQFSDPFIQKYFAGRDALIVQEDKHRSDKDFRELLSPMAQEACAIVSQIRFEEQQTVWSAAAEDEMAESSGSQVFPGMMFTFAKQRMEGTKLWKIMRKMPKGALLHCHVEAMVDQGWLFEEALSMKGMHIVSSKPLDTDRARETEMFKFVFHLNDKSSSSSIWSANYTLNSSVLLTEAADNFPKGGRAGFISWLISRCSIGSIESISHHQGPNTIWAKFQSCFGILKTFVYIEPVWRKFLNRMFTQLAEDNVRWVDVRAAFAFEYFKEGKDTPEDPLDGYTEMVRVFGEEVEKFKASLAGKSFWGARLLWTTIRSFDNRTICENMKHCIAVKQEFPELISGFDLVGHEDPGRTLADLTPILFWFRKACAQANLTIPFFFHAGETLGTGSEADTNLFDAITLGSRRLGHAFSLYKHPLLMNMVRDRRILVECCPISNEVLRLTHSISSHPVPALIAQGVPVSLSNDDPALLGHETAGMTHDFFQMVQAVESMGLEGLGSLAENSVRWAAFEDLGQKEWTESLKMGMYGGGLTARRMKEWKGEWEKFCQWIVMEFGVDVDLEE